MLAGPLSLSVCLLLFCLTTADTLKKNLTIGYLPAIKGELRDRQGLIASGAIQMAVDKVNIHVSSNKPRFTFTLHTCFMLQLGTPTVSINVILQ